MTSHRRDGTLIAALLAGILQASILVAGVKVTVDPALTKGETGFPVDGNAEGRCLDRKLDKIGWMKYQSITGSKSAVGS
jgi:hypothetical protein